MSAKILRFTSQQCMQTIRYTLDLNARIELVYLLSVEFVLLGALHTNMKFDK